MNTRDKTSKEQISKQELSQFSSEINSANQININLIRYKKG